MVYIAVSAISLSIAIPLFMKGYSYISRQSSIDSMQMLAAQINSNMDYYSSEFPAYLPQSICSASTPNDTLVANNVTYHFSGGVEIDVQKLCEKAGGFDTISMHRLYNGTFVVSG